MAFLMILLLASLAASASAACDPGSGWYGDDTVGVCYLLSPLINFEAPTADWYSAADYCSDQGGSLATIRTEAQQTFLRVNLGTATSGESIWTAGNDISSDGVWEWGEGTGDSVVYQQWEDGQPDGGTSQNCMAVDVGELTYRWADASCDNLYEVLCEKPL